MAIFHNRLKPMVNHGIFVSVPFADFNIGTIHDMLKKIKTTMNWSIGKRTPNRSRLSVGDKVLYLQGGIVKISEQDYRKIIRNAGKLD